MPEPAPESVDLEGELAHRLSLLSLQERVQLLTGRDFWTTWPIEKIGLRRLLVSDGPSGVRGELWDERSPSLNLPSATALSSAWDKDIAARYGAASAAEARRKGVDVVLGPTINLHRSPLGGRHFEAFSEDPILTGELAAAYVEGVQRNGIGATPKHYVANDFETDRFTADVQVSDRALRELYLLAFEKAITEAHAWLVMSAYNSVNGATMTENDLLETPLNSEWGFDGVVISDWTAVRGVNSARHSQDLVMPGPSGPWGDALVAAVREGDVSEAAVDRKVLRLLRLAARVGALEGIPAEVPEQVDAEDWPTFARRAATEGSVLVRNTGALPLNASTVKSVAVVGHNARNARTQGGGSATVVPESVVSPLNGLRAAMPSAEISYSVGAIVQEGVAEFPPATMANPVSGGPGARVTMLDADGTELYSEDRFASSLVYFGGDAPIGRMSRFVFETRLTPETTETVRLGFAAVGRGRVFVNGELLLDRESGAIGADLGAALLAPPTQSAEITLHAGEPVEVRVELEPPQNDGALSDALGITIGTEPADVDSDALIAEAVAEAKMAEVAVIVVGTNSRVESEGHDRESLLLPGRQDDLVRAVAAANPNTIVVVNSGSPVELPWRNDVAAVLLSYFGGQEYGNAVADMLTGAAEPGGRLPTTWPTRQSDAPVIDVTPQEGVVCYEEGIHIGYRAWLRAGAKPAYWFGHGMGFTTWEIGEATAELFNKEVVVRSTVTNTGFRDGKHVVQVYAERPDSVVDRPARWLVGFAPVRVAAGASTNVEVRFPKRYFAHWDNGWQYEPGEYALRVGSSASDLSGETAIVL